MKQEGGGLPCIRTDAALHEGDAHAHTRRHSHVHKEVHGNTQGRGGAWRTHQEQRCLQACKPPRSWRRFPGERQDPQWFHLQMPMCGTQLPAQLSYLPAPKISS